MTTAQADVVVDEQARRFEELKGELIERWDRND
jgi:hypothetical protein